MKLGKVEQEVIIKALLDYIAGSSQYEHTPIPYAEALENLKRQDDFNKSTDQLRATLSGTPDQPTSPEELMDKAEEAMNRSHPEAQPGVADPTNEKEVRLIDPDRSVSPANPLDPNGSPHTVGRHYTGVGEPGVAEVAPLWGKPTSSDGFTGVGEAELQKWYKQKLVLLSDAGEMAGLLHRAMDGDTMSASETITAQTLCDNYSPYRGPSPNPLDRQPIPDLAELEEQIDPKPEKISEAAEMRIDIQRAVGLLERLGSGDALTTGELRIVEKLRQKYSRSLEDVEEGRRILENVYGKRPTSPEKPPAPPAPGTILSVVAKTIKLLQKSIDGDEMLDAETNSIEALYAKCREWVRTRPDLTYGRIITTQQMGMDIRAALMLAVRVMDGRHFRDDPQELRSFCEKYGVELKP